MTVLGAGGVRKAFSIPSARRDTVREHLLHFWKRRRFTRLTILDDVTFSLRKGEALGIMGRNGCGKSTLLKIIAGIYPPDAGTVTRHAPITPMLELGIGWNPELDAIDNIFLIGSVMGMGLGEIDRAVDGILEFAELAEFAHLKLKFYSSGMASRLAYAVAFRAVRDVLILDEIFAVGDAGFKQRCRARYQELREAGHSILMVTHEPGILVDSCDRALLLEKGRILMEGEPKRVADAYLALVSAS